jgi:glycosyltransferase involved in cell wall biosynthesis
MTTAVERNLQLGLVLWSGVVGGAEVFSLALADRMNRHGHTATIVFIEDPQPLVRRITNAAVPYRSLGMTRGRETLRRPRRYAAQVAQVARDGVLLVDCGYMGAALRMGGYSGPIAAVEHGALLGIKSKSIKGIVVRTLGRALGALADDVEIAVSDFVLANMAEHPHARMMRRIYNGIDASQYQAAQDITRKDVCSIAFAGRLVHGKGTDYMLRAVACIQPSRPLMLSIAGEGPERERLEALSTMLGIESSVRFLGLVDDMPGFWREADIAVVPSAEFIEACPMTPLEAMAAGRPVVATKNGGLPELVIDGKTGMLVPPCDVESLAAALDAYIADEELRLSHGRAAKAHVVENFDIDRSARSYLDVFADLARG